MVFRYRMATFHERAVIDDGAFGDVFSQIVVAILPLYMSRLGLVLLEDVVLGATLLKRQALMHD